MSQPIDTRWKPSEEQLEIIRALSAAAAAEKTEADFVRSSFSLGGTSLWSQIKYVAEPPRTNGKGELVLSYFDKVSPATRDLIFERLQTDLEEIQRHRALDVQTRETEVYNTTKIRAIAQAVRECKDKRGPERLIMSVAPTGGGKTMTANYLRSKFNARFVEVRDIWRDSKNGFVPLLDICRAVGVRVKTKNRNNVAGIQDDLIKFVSERQILLCFDEGEHFGKAALNLLKLLLNKTRIVPVIFCVPSEFERWPDYWENEAAQIARRTHLIVQLTDIHPKDAALFFPRDQFADAETALPAICKAASDPTRGFGHFSLIKRIATKLDGIAQAGEDDVTEAIKAALRQMGRENQSTKKSLSTT